MKRYKVLLCGLFLFGIAHAQYTVLHNFSDTNGSPGGDLTLVGKKLYGMTGVLAPPYYGSVFSIDTDGTNYRILHKYASSNGVFILPGYNSLTYNNGMLYGMTPQGGKDSIGDIFAIDTDGSHYRELFYFDTLSGGGQLPTGSLTLSGNKFYGMTNGGGIDYYGCIFSIDTNGSGFKIIHYFLGAYGWGCNPYGSLTLSGRKLYGMSSEKGIDGNVFSIDTDGNNYTILHEFASLTDGGKPYGSLLLSNGVLYGMSSGELASLPNFGNIFSIDTDGSNYRNMLEFNGIDGQSPFGSLILSGSTLYGMTPFTIFSIDTNGTGFRNMFQWTLNDTEGGDPSGSLTLSGGVLYGMTSEGGANGYGVIFRIDTNAVSTLSINNLNTNRNTVKVYPNPSSGIFTLMDNSQFTIDNGGETVEIYNTLGQKVFSQLSIFHFPSPNGSAGRALSINLSGQPNGVYLYRVLGENGNLIGEGKLVVQK